MCERDLALSGFLGFRDGDFAPEIPNGCRALTDLGLSGLVPAADPEVSRIPDSPASCRGNVTGGEGGVEEGL